MEHVGCKECTSPDCHGCNLLRLEQMLKSGKFDALMDETRGIKTGIDVRPVVCCKDCVYSYPYGLEIKCTKHSGKADRLGEDATYSEFHSENWYCADAQRKRGKRGEV